MGEVKKPLHCKIRVIFHNDIISDIILIILPGVLGAVFYEG